MVYDKIIFAGFLFAVGMQHYDAFYTMTDKQIKLFYSNNYKGNSDRYFYLCP